MISWVRIISQRVAAATMTVRPANWPALVTFVKEIRVAYHAFRPWLTAMAPKPKLTEK